jgi:PAS domain S-box-containing protein
MLEATPDLVGFADPQGRILYINCGGRRMLGLADDEPLTNVADYHPPEVARLLVGAAIPAAIRTGSWSRETSFRGRDGRTIPCLQVILAHKNLDGSVDFLSTTARDVSEQKRAAEELRRRKDFLDQLVRHLPVAVFVKNARNEFRYELINEKVAVLFGTTDAGVIGRNDFEINRRELADFFRAKDEEAMVTGRVVDIPEEPYEQPGSGRLLLHTIKVPLYDEAGQPAYLLGIAEDITERRRREEEVRLLQTTALDVTGAEDLSSALEVVPRRVCEATGWVLGQAWLPDGDRASSSAARRGTAGRRGVSRSARGANGSRSCRGSGCRDVCGPASRPSGSRTSVPTPMCCGPTWHARPG